MLDVVFEKRDSYIVGFGIEGHAGFDDVGSDILCSAVSFVSQTTLNGILEVLKIDAQYEAEDDGYLKVSVANEENEDIERCQVLFKTMLLGIKSLIKDGYGEYIRLFIKEV